MQSEVVATGWMSQTDFLTGLALIQALPGPLFNLAAYIGAHSCLHSPTRPRCSGCARLPMTTRTCLRAAGPSVQCFTVTSSIAGTGAIIAANVDIPSIIGIAVCWLALFSPGVLMIFAVLPWWGTFRRFGTYRR